jgi:hypothetical protein
MVTFLQIPGRIFQDAELQRVDYYLAIENISEIAASSIGAGSADTGNTTVANQNIRLFANPALSAFEYVDIVLNTTDPSRAFHSAICNALITAKSPKVGGAFYALPLDAFYNDGAGVAFRALSVGASTFNSGTAITNRNFNGTTDTLPFTTSAAHNLKVGDRVQCTFGDASNTALVSISGYYDVVTVDSSTIFRIIPRGITGASSGTLSATTVLINANNLISSITWN